MNYNYSLNKDVKFICELLGFTMSDICKKCSISKRTLNYSFVKKPSNTTLEKIYSFIYKQGYRLSTAKTELFLENLKKGEKLLFHGSKYGFDIIDCNGSRKDADFSNGFYCSGNLDAAIGFVENEKHSSVYAFKINIEKLKCYEFECNLEWMIAISYFRGKLNNYKNNSYIKKIINKIKNADLIIAPIADNKMFEILNNFVDGEITSTQALHSLSASRLGKQYVFKTKKAISSLKFIDRFYLCEEERVYSKKISFDNSDLIQTKLNLAKRQYRNKGRYIDEIFI